MTHIGFKILALAAVVLSTPAIAYQKQDSTCVRVVKHHYYRLLDGVPMFKITVNNWVFDDKHVQAKEYDWKKGTCRAMKNNHWWRGKLIPGYK